MRIKILFNPHRIYSSKSFTRFVWFLVLLPFSLIYGFIVVLRYVLYQLSIFSSYKSTLPVLSVGNISSGGTGKTPIVVNLAQYFLSQGKKVAVLTRGYKGYEKGPCFVSDSDSARFGDEACMLVNMLSDAKVVVAKSRVDGAKFIEKTGDFDIIILDDGFQHLKLKRNFDLVLIDSSRAALDNFMLPSGLLREPWYLLKRADAVLLTRTNHISFEESKNLRSGLTFIGQVFRSSEHLSSYYSLNSREELSLELIQEKKTLIVCALGNPFQFLKAAEKVGFSIKGHLFFPDHHQFKTHDIQKMLSVAQKFGSDQILITEKDAVKIKPLLVAINNKNVKFIVASQEVEIENQELFYDLVIEKLF